MTPQMFFVVILLSALSFLNIVVPISGSTTTTPLLAFIVDPHAAIGLASVMFLLSGLVRIVVFRAYIVWKEVQTLLPSSLIASFLGAISTGFIPGEWLLLILFLTVLYFLFKKVGVFSWKTTRKAERLRETTIGLFSGYLQGTGIGGSDMRNTFLLANNLSVQEMHGTTAVIGASIFSVSTLVRLWTHQLEIVDTITVLILLPIIILATILGKKTLLAVSKESQSKIILFVMSISVILIGYKAVTAFLA